LTTNQLIRTKLWKIILFIKLYLHTKFHVNQIKIRHCSQNASPPYETPMQHYATKNNRALNLNFVNRLGKNQPHSAITSTVIAQTRVKRYLNFIVGALTRPLINSSKPNFGKSFYSSNSTSIPNFMLVGSKSDITPKTPRPHTRHLCDTMPLKTIGLSTSILSTVWPKINLIRQLHQQLSRRQG